MNVPVRALKDRLSDYLRRVQAGERLVVTDHERPIAEIVPLDPAKLSSVERLALLARVGDVTAPRGRGFKKIERSKARGRPVSATIVEERR